MGFCGTWALLFVPASTGILRYLDLLSEHALALGAALLVSTVASLVVTVLRRRGRPFREAAAGRREFAGIPP